MQKSEETIDNFESLILSKEIQPQAIVQYLQTFEVVKCLEDGEFGFLITNRGTTRESSYMRPFASKNGRRATLRTNNVHVYGSDFNDFLHEIGDKLKDFASFVFTFDQGQLPRKT